MRLLRRFVFLGLLVVCPPGSAWATTDLSGAVFRASGALQKMGGDPDRVIRRAAVKSHQIAAWAGASVAATGDRVKIHDPRVLVPRAFKDVWHTLHQWAAKRSDRTVTTTLDRLVKASGQPRATVSAAVKYLAGVGVVLTVRPSSPATRRRSRTSGRWRRSCRPSRYASNAATRFARS